MLTEEQVRQFHEEGYLFLPETFRPEEVAVLREEAELVYRQQRPEVWREKSGAPRTAFAAHLYNEGFGLLGRHPRMIHPVEQLFGEPVYMHQYKVNAKASFTGDVWQWHQDYGTWARDDLMPTPRAMNIALFLDEVTEFNGALMFIPRSHHQGTLEAGHDLSTTSYPLWTISNEAITQLVREGGLIAPKGKPGSVMLFHSNLVHGSPSNMSPFDRTIVYLSLCHVDNHIQRFQRAEWIAHRDFTPIQPLEDNCLRDLAQEQAA